MNSNKLCRAYAGALLEIGISKDIVPGLKEELGFLANLLSGEKEIMSLLNSPVISGNRKKEFIDKVFKPYFSVYIIHFIKILIDNNRQSMLSEIYAQFCDLTDELSNIQRIKITTAVKAGPPTLKRIEDIFAAKLKKKIIIDHEIDDKILGGIIVRVSDKVIDGSIIKDLRLLKSNLVHGSGF